VQSEEVLKKSMRGKRLKGKGGILGGTVRRGEYMRSKGVAESLEARESAQGRARGQGKNKRLKKFDVAGGGRRYREKPRGGVSQAKPVKKEKSDGGNKKLGGKSVHEWEGGGSRKREDLARRYLNWDSWIFRFAKAKESLGRKSKKGRREGRGD